MAYERLTWGYVEGRGWREAGAVLAVIMELLRNHDSEGPHLLMSSSLIDAVRPHLPAGLDVPVHLGGDEQGIYCMPWRRFPTRARLGLVGRIPVASTVWRFLVRVDATVLQAVLTGWLQARLPTCLAAAGRSDRVVIAVDGKVLRAARLPGGRQVHLLSADDTATGIVLAQVTIVANSNEIPAFAPLLAQVQARLGSLAGTLIVADALHAQVGHAHTVAALGGHLMVQVKANQPTLLRQLASLPWAQVPVGHRTRSRGHGRAETRTVKATTVQTPGGLGFPHAAQAVRITRTRTIVGTTTRETAYLIVTLPATDAQPVELNHWARRHWHIENRLHWIRDVTYGEDAHQARTGNGPAVAAVLRNTAIGYHRSNGETNIARATRRASRRPHDLIDAVTSGARTQ